MVQISSRDYTYENNSENKTYQNNGNINIDGTLKINEIDSSIESLKNKGLSVRVKLEEDGKIIEIPQGTVLTINNNENFETQNGIIEAKLLKEITNLETIQDFNISLNMSDVLPIYRIEAGKYNLLIEIVLSEDDLLESLVQKTIEIPLTIVEMKSDSIGFKSEIQNMQNVASDKIQLINKGEKAERSIGLNYNGTLNNPNVKITILEKTGEFEYTNINNTDNANKIKIEINEKETYEISNITNNANLTINFSDKLSVGTYKILFELYDDNGEKQTESVTNFIVWE
jgi:hypothetical protein